ncbi:hypothetical protein [Salmonirosea aquatica]|uniref:Uncharacterized protein n=1 Tax=Salmonirosea aquatica TaxID=2654236 RepID=A0A7C9BI39_9BACT|nr:hypothetical protein [Cytophagaceae bacterium SJW1-29]
MNAELSKVQVVAAGFPTSRLLVEKENLSAGNTYQQSVRFKSLPDSEGSYELKLTEATQTRTFRFGYFTNGAAFDKRFSLRVKKDTVLVESVRRELWR